MAQLANVVDLDEDVLVPRIGSPCGQGKARPTGQVGSAQELVCIRQPVPIGVTCAVRHSPIEVAQGTAPAASLRERVAGSKGVLERSAEPVPIGVLGIVCIHPYLQALRRRHDDPTNLIGHQGRPGTESRGLSASVRDQAPRGVEAEQLDVGTRPARGRHRVVPIAAATRHRDSCGRKLDRLALSIDEQLTAPLTNDQKPQAAGIRGAVDERDAVPARELAPGLHIPQIGRRTQRGKTPQADEQRRTGRHTKRPRYDLRCTRRGMGRRNAGGAQVPAGGWLST